MLLVGLTGGIGAGKSTAAAILRGLGIPIIDTDAIARDLVQPGQPALQEIVTMFGGEVLTVEGSLNRARLAELVFSNPAAREKLEQILHPRIRECWQAEVVQWRSANCDIGVVEIPLLFETDAKLLFDLVVCIACTARSQLSRLEARGWSTSQINGRLAAQWSMERKIAAAEVVVWTEGEMAVHELQWSRLVKRWRGR